MTIDQTRLMAVEFERRVQTFDPTTVSTAKLDTDTIFAYLNQFQYLYIKLSYVSIESLDGASRGSRRLSDMMKTLIKHDTLYPIGHDYNDDLLDVFELPSDYFMYIRSSSNVSGTYKNLDIPSSVANDFIKLDDVQLVLNTFYNQGGIIRRPLVVLESVNDSDSVMEVFHDNYTTINNITLTYYRKPKEFNIIDNIPCELPYDCFEDLVTGAVELYFNYKYKVSLASEAARSARRRKQLQPESE